MKENLRVLNIDGETEWREVKSLFFSLGFSSVISGLTFMFTDKHGPLCLDITLPELRELARPKEYLNDKFELVVTNQPEDGWRLVPDGAVALVQFPNLNRNHFYKMDLKRYRLQIFNHPDVPEKWSSTSYGSVVEIMRNTSNCKILWKRENKVETSKGREGNAGRFLHQWAYEAFGRGEDVQHTPCERDCDWTSTSIANPISIFSAREMKFRLKPKTITIGSRTINKPISVKPEKDKEFFIPDLFSDKKYARYIWNGNSKDIQLLTKNLCHLTAVDAIAMTDALLELMK